MSAEKHYLIVVPNYWGKGKTIDAAKKQVRLAGGRLNGKKLVYEVHPEAYVNDFGDIVSPAEHPPVQVH